MEREKEKREKKRMGKEIIAVSIKIARESLIPMKGAFLALEAGVPFLKHKKGMVRHLFCMGVFLLTASVFCVASLACFPLSVYPAGFAYLAALGGTGKFRFGNLGEKNAAYFDTAFLLSAFTGTLFSCLWIKKWGFFYFLSYLLLFFIRAFYTGGKFRDGILFRVTLSSAFAVGLGMLLALFEGFPVGRVFGAVSMGILTPILTYLIGGFYVDTATEHGEAPFPGKRRVYLEASVFTLFYLFLFALKDVTVIGCNLSFVLASFATLAVSRHYGALFGGAVGVIGGMACAASFVAPALGVGGFFSGLFFEYSPVAAVMIAFVSSCGYSLFTEGFSEFSYFCADYLFAILIFFPFLNLLPKERAVGVKSAPREVMHRETMRRTKEKLKTMSDAFHSLSEVFYTVSDTMKKPTLTEASHLVSGCFSRICSRCALSGICWGAGESASNKESAFLSTRLITEGSVTLSDLSPAFARQCKESEKLVELINTRFKALSGEEVKNHKTGLLAGEYSSVSRLLQSTAQTLDRELEYNPALEERAKGALEKLGVSYRRVAVFGSREMKIDVYGVSPERVCLGTDRILEVFEEAFGCPFSSPDFLMFEESVVMRLRRKRKILLECAKSGCAKSGETVSGDSCRFFETDRDFFYTLICDGMGSGREAAFTSRLSSIFIEKLMHCATPKNVTLEMLNSFLMAKTDEVFTTVDLLEVDLLSGEADFIKAGAAPSFVLRGERLHRIESRTPPAGALSGMCAEKTSFALRDGDFIILMSDGAESVGEGSGWLVRLLSQGREETAAALCDRIFTHAKERGQFRDDLSISVLKIMNCK